MSSAVETFLLFAAKKPLAIRRLRFATPRMTGSKRRSTEPSHSWKTASLPLMFLHARAGTEAVRSSLPQLTHAPFTPRKIAFQIQ
jgi:hypothetical protein